jgi:diguanylate cyclase (GGDEF)-like protein/PAS domain S-box-containing protein
MDNIRRLAMDLRGLTALRQALAVAQAEATVSREWLRMTEEMAQVGQWRILLPGYEIHWSDEIYRLHGLRRESFVPDIQNALTAFHPDDRAMVESRIVASVTNRTPYEIEARIVRPDGDIRHVLSRGTLQLNAAGEPSALIGVIIDISKQKLVEEELRKRNLAKKQANAALSLLVFEDSLTGLRNRRYFDDALASAFDRAERDGATLGLIMVDLDNFKEYNDFYGHPAGDECLRRVAAAIAGVPARPGDLAARYGGEEIVLLLPGMDARGLVAMADRLVRAVRALNLAHQGSRRGHVTISCGAALRTPADTSMRPLDLLCQADAALYDAKRHGRDRACVFGPAPPAAARFTYAGH